MSDIQEKEIKFLINEDGREIPISRIKPEIVAEDRVVREIMSEGIALRELIIEFKSKMLGLADKHMDDVFRLYNARIGGTRGGTRLHSFDRRLRVEITHRDYYTVTPAVEAAKALVNEILDDLIGEDTNEDLVAIVNSAFARNKKTGAIAADEILKLKNKQLSHPKWPEAQDALASSVEKVSSKRAIVLHEKSSDDVCWQQISLDFSRMEV